MSGNKSSRLTSLIEVQDYLQNQGVSNKDNYDCTIHLNGKKNNLVMLYILNIFNLKPLAVTFNHHYYTESQKNNIHKALELFDLDHTMFTARISVINKIKNRSHVIFSELLQLGSIAFNINTALKYKVSFVALDSMELIKGMQGNIQKLRNSYFSLERYPFKLKKLESNIISTTDLLPYRLPTDSEIKDSKLDLITFESLIDIENTEIENFIDNHFSWNENEVKGTESFWIGFPKEWNNKQVEKINIKRKLTSYEKCALKSEYGKPLYNKILRYCTRCCMPETAEELAFDELGMCQPCRSSEQKMHINWVEREKKLSAILNKYNLNDKINYEIIVPISGGKDSTFQLYVLTQVYKKKALAVTFSHNWYSDTGRYNLLNSITQFDVDHLMFTPRRSVINKLAKKSLNMIGDSCWHCHSGVGSFPLQVAVKYGINLLVWGESVAENDGRATYEKPIVFDRDYFTKISARYYAEEMMDENISKLDILPYVLPSAEEISKKSVVGIHLGDYMFWDDERQMEFVRDNFGWREDKVEGTYKGYKSVECLMAGIHDYTKFIKRGFGRGTDHASQDVRTGLLTREEGFELAKKFDSERPIALDYYLSITGFSEEEFENILKNNRDEKAKKIL